MSAFHGGIQGAFMQLCIHCLLVCQPSELPPAHIPVLQSVSFKLYLLTISFKLHLFLFIPVRIHTLISCTAMTVTSCTIFLGQVGLNVLGRGLLVLLPVMDMTVGLLKIFMSDLGACGRCIGPPIGFADISNLSTAQSLCLLI